MSSHPFSAPAARCAARLPVLFAAVLGVVLVASQAAAAGDPADLCEAAKNSVAGKYSLCLHKAQAKFVAGGAADTTAYEMALLRCDSKYNAKWHRVENAGAGLCPTSGDADLIQDYLDTCVFAAEEAMAGGGLPTCDVDLATCTDALGACGDDLGSCSRGMDILSSDLANCSGHLETCYSDGDTCRGNLDACSGQLGTCGSDLSTCNGTVDTCNASLGTCNVDLGTCNSSLGTCNADLGTCNASLATAGSGTALAGQVLAGRTFTSSAGLDVAGTMINVGQQNLVAGLSPVTITRGFHDGTGTVAALKCGNGILEAPERCDASSLGGLTCAELGFASGTLACSNACTFDLSGCSTDQPWRRVFVTSTSMRGDFGGLASGDAACQAHANTALLGGSWTAWLSDGATDASDRITDDQYRLVDETTIVAQSKADLLDGIAASPIRLNEFASSVDADVWTGTRADGSRSSSHCGSWTSAVDGGLVGNSQSTVLWTDKGLHNCGQSRRLYCFEGCQADTQNDPDNCGHCGVQCGDGRSCSAGVCSQYVFRTSEDYTGGQIGGLSGGDAKCQSLASAAGLPGIFKAWLATTGVPVGSRLDTTFTGQYRLPTGELVATGWAGLASASHQNGIWKTESGGTSYLTTHVWTGANPDGSPRENSCNGWTSSAGTDTGGAGVLTDTNLLWTQGSNRSCVSALYLYCIEQ